MTKRQYPLLLALCLCCALLPVQASEIPQDEPFYVAPKALYSLHYPREWLALDSEQLAKGVPVNDVGNSIMGISARLVVEQIGPHLGADDSLFLPAWGKGHYLMVSYTPSGAAANLEQLLSEMPGRMEAYRQTYPSPVFTDGGSLVLAGEGQALRLAFHYRYGRGNFEVVQHFFLHRGSSAMVTLSWQNPTRQERREMGVIEAQLRDSFQLPGNVN